MVDLDPQQRRRQAHAIRTCIEAGAEVDNGIGAFHDGPQDEVVDDAGADRHRPAGHRRDARQVPQDVAPVFAGQAFGEWIVEQRIVPACFERAKRGDHECRVGDVLDQRSGHLTLPWSRRAAGVSRMARARAEARRRVVR